MIDLISNILFGTWCAGSYEPCTNLIPPMIIPVVLSVIYLGFKIVKHYHKPNEVVQ